MSGHTPQCAAWRAFMFAWRVLTSSLLSQRQPGALACQLEPHGFQNRLQNRTSSTLPLMSCRLRTPAKKTILLRLKHDVQYQQHGMVCHLISERHALAQPNSMRALVSRIWHESSDISPPNFPETADLDIRNCHVAGVQPPPVLLIRLQHTAHIQRFCLSSSPFDTSMAPLPVQAIAGSRHACMT